MKSHFVLAETVSKLVHDKDNKNNKNLWTPFKKNSTFKAPDESVFR